MNRSILSTFGAILLTVSLASAETVSRRWAGSNTPAAYPGTMKVLGSGPNLKFQFDLSALPDNTKIYEARLFCFTSEGQPDEPARIIPEGSNEPLTLIAPWYRSYDATVAVRSTAETPEQTLTLAVKRLEGLQPARSYLEIRYEGEADHVPEQVTGLRVIHHHGQSFAVWRELKEFQPPEDKIIYIQKFAEGNNQVVQEPGEGFGGLPRAPAITLGTLRKMQGIEPRQITRGVKLVRVRDMPDVKYRLYRHNQPITAQNIHQARLVGEANPLCGYDEKMRVISFKGEYLNQKEVTDSPIPTLCVEDGKGIAPGEALYVHTPARAGTIYYAVTTVRDGTENTTEFSEANSLPEPVEETPEVPMPVLQRVQVDKYRKKVLEHWYMLYLAPPLANRENIPLHVVVGIPDPLPDPAPMKIQTFASGFNMVQTMRVPSEKHVTLMMEEQISYFDDLCYHEGLGTLMSYREGKVDFFSERCLLHVIHWAMDKWNTDRSRVEGGPLHFALRHPEIFGLVHLTNYTHAYNYLWAPQSLAMPENLGPRELAKTPQGQNAWDQYNLGWYTKTYPQRDIPFLLCRSGTGKDSGHTAEFGWRDDPRGWAALRDGRQPFIAVWTEGFCPEVSRMIHTMRWDKSIPAFSRCSLDNNPGNGDPTDGDYFGQINGYLMWEYDEVVEAKDKWEMTVSLAPSAPRKQCTVDITPRHCKAFAPQAGEAFRWTNTAKDTGQVVEQGEVQADRWGLVTLEQVTVRQGGNRIAIQRTE